MNVPIAGFIKAASARGHKLVPLICANATPSAHVTDEIFESVVKTLCEDLAKALPVDAVYLDLHGAMVTESLEDGEGEILARVRAVVGPRIPVVASLDLHANVTQRMVDQADGMVAYRTYPHIDMADTGERACDLLEGMLKAGSPPAKFFRQLPFMIPITAQCTFIEPGAAIYKRLAEIEATSGTMLSYCSGFPAADIRDCAPSVFGFGADARKAKDATDALLTSLPTPSAITSPRSIRPRTRSRAPWRAAGATANPSCWRIRKTIPAPAATATRRACWPRCCV